MSQGVCLLDEALNLARQEMAALEGGAYDKAVELAERRGEVTSMAWHMLDDSQADEYRALAKKMHENEMFVVPKPMSINELEKLLVDFGINN